MADVADEDDQDPRQRLEPPRLFGGKQSREQGVRATKPPRQPRPPKPPKERRPDRAPRQLPTGRAAAAVAGVVVGLLLVVATYGALRGCEAVRGTSSCGGAGFPLLALIFALAVVIGSALLRRLAVSDPTSTSLLATALTAVVALLFLMEVLDHWSMVLVIPIVSALTFLLSYWVTTTFVEPAERPTDASPTAGAPADR